jgi:hypothetical protein
MTSILNQVSERIYFIRGHRVMLDNDLAKLYEVPAKRLNEQVKRNLQRFPEDFCFQLTNHEVTILRSQFATSSFHGGRRYHPYAFTEQGVAMLSSVLKSERAVQVNVEIMRAFVRVRELMYGNKELAKKIAQLEDKYDIQFKVVFDAIREIMSPVGPLKKRRIGI